MPNLIKMIDDKADLKRVAFSIASYRHYLKYKKDDKGVQFEINDPWLTDQDINLIRSDNPLDFLGLTPFQSTDLKNINIFIEPYTEIVNGLKEKGVFPILESLINV